MNNSNQKFSDCCGVPVTGEMEDYGLCPSCKEHCEFVDEEDEEENETPNITQP